MSLPPGLWERVYQRDHGMCIAPQLDPSVGPCRDRFGNTVWPKRDGSMPRRALTFAHIKMMPGGSRVDDERHGVMACWEHHVFGSMWVTSKRGLGLVRNYLHGLYGDDYD